MSDENTPTVKPWTLTEAVREACRKVAHGVEAAQRAVPPRRETTSGALQLRPGLRVTDAEVEALYVMLARTVDDWIEDTKRGRA